MPNKIPASAKDKNSLSLTDLRGLFITISSVLASAFLNTFISCSSFVRPTITFMRTAFGRYFLGEELLSAPFADFSDFKFTSCHYELILFGYFSCFMSTIVNCCQPLSTFSITFADENLETPSESQMRYKNELKMH